MFVFENPSDLDTDWFLGDETRNLGRISKKLVRCISNFHFLGIQFLFENFVKKRGGAILNQDEDMNMPLQVAAFLNSVKDKISDESPVLIVCPKHTLCIWHYHVNESGFKPQIISLNGLAPCEVYLLSFESLKLVDQVLHLDLFCVVIDELDSVATKLIVRKIKGNFNIGLTKRNFYVNPDQKLRWMMLNWASLGCVGKLNDFYRIDRLHFLAFADNYKFWWMRLTWNFCDSFERPSEVDLQDYHQKLKSWGEIHQITNDLIFKEIKSKRKVKDTKDHTEKKKKRKCIINNEIFNNPFGIPTTSYHTNSTPKNDDGEITKSDPILSMIDKKTVSFSPEQTTRFKQTHDLVNPAEKSSEKALEDNEKTESDDILNMFCQSTRKNSRNNLQSDDDDPIISIINSQNQKESQEISDNFLDINKLSQSSESDSEFLSSIVKNKDRSSRYYRSQQISEVLTNLSDSEEKMENSDDESFFSELISGKKVESKDYVEDSPEVDDYSILNEKLDKLRDNSLNE